MNTLAQELQALHRTLLTYRQQQPGAAFLYAVANEQKEFFGLADREGEILLETTRDAFYQLSHVFELLLLRLHDDSTQLWGLRAKDMEKTDVESGLPLLELLVQERPAIRPK